MAKKGRIPVVSSSFCHPETKDLEFTENMVKDANGNLIFQVDNNVIVDAEGLPILTLRKQTLSMHKRWEVYRGESKDEKDLIFSARISSMLQIRDKIHVFLANNKSEDVCDYMIKESWFGGPCKIYAGDSTTIVAQMDKETSKVRVYPNIDQAFIVALNIIFDAINTSTSSAGEEDKAGGNAKAVLAVAEPVAGTVVDAVAGPEAGVEAGAEAEGFMEVISAMFG